MDTINFSHPWCGNKDHFKIHEQTFTTIRKHNQKKYKVGKSIGISFMSKPVKECKIVKIITCSLESLTDEVFLTDTGYKKKDSLNIFSKMYHVSIAELNHILFDLIFLETEEELFSEATNGQQLCLKFS